MSFKSVYAEGKKEYIRYKQKKQEKEKKKQLEWFCERAAKSAWTVW